MVRFLVVMVLALALCAGVAWSFGLFSGEPSTTAAGSLQGGKAVNPWKPGAPLYKSVALPSAQPFGDELLPNPNGIRLGKQIVISDSTIQPFDKQDASSSKDGLLLFVGNVVDQE